MTRSVTTAVFIGVLGGFWFALVNGSIELFQNYVEGVWRYQFGVRSFAAPLVGAVIGALAGANIHLALTQARADAFVRGALAGCAVGTLLVAGQAVLVALATLLQVYDIEYGFLLTRFVGILSVAVLIGAVAGLLGGVCSLAAPLPGAVVGALAAAALALPVIVVALTVLMSGWDISVAWVFASTLIYALPQLPVLLAGAGSGAIIGAVHKQRAMDGADIDSIAVGVIMGAVAAVTASSPSFHYVILGLESSASSFSIALFVFRTLLGLVTGSVVGLLIIAARRWTSSSNLADADTVSLD